MADFLLLRFDAPLMSFGGPMVDRYGVTQEHPTLSMVTGLLGNALGYGHRDAVSLNRLQARLRIAARRDRAGQRVMDFQTVDLGQPFMGDTGWTTRGQIEARGGGQARDGTHIRERDYLVDSVFTLAVMLEAASEAPTLEDLAGALTEPRRPLFLGRKTCLPAAPLLVGLIQAPSLLHALRSAPRLSRWREDGDGGEVAAWWPGTEGAEGGTILPVVDERDWRNQIHVGRRLVCHGTLRLEEVPDAD